MPETRTDWTAEMLESLPDDGNRYEVIDGELFVTPAPSLTHQRAVARLHLHLMLYGNTVGLEVLAAPIGIRFSPRTEVQPDICAWRLQAGRLPASYAETEGLLLAVEVLSPSTARADRHTKRRLYQRENVIEYWIVDTANRLVERWSPGDEEPQVLLTALDWQPVPEHEALRIDLEAYFRAVFGE